MSNSLDNHTSKWYYLVNIIAGAMVTIMGFIVKALEMQHFNVARLYTIYMLIIFLMYFALRFPTFMSRCMLIYLEYIARKKKIKSEIDFETVT